MSKKKKEIFFLNLVFILMIFLIIIMPRFLPKNKSIAFSFNIICYIIFQILFFAVYFFYLDKEKSKIQKFINGIKKNFSDALIISAIKLSVIFSLIFLLRYFLEIKTFFGYFFSIIIIFIFFIFELSLFWYYPITACQPKNKNKIKNIKKSFDLFLAHPFLTYKIFYLSILRFVISCFFLLLFPGISGIIFYIAENYKQTMEENI